MWDERGQAAVEWVATVTLLAVVFGALAVPAATGTGIGRSITREMVRALCRVTGGECEHDREPCTVRAGSHSATIEANLAIVKLGRGYVALVEHRSDGRVAVSRVKLGEAGLEGALIGAEAKASWGESRFAVGGDLRAAVIAKAARGATWVVPPARVNGLVEAFRLDAAGTLAGSLPGELLSRRATRGLPPPDEIHGEAGWSASLGGDGTGGPAQATVRLSAGNTAGSRLDRRTGRRTVYLRGGREAAASFGLGGVDVTSGTSALRDVQWALELDRRGRPLTLTISERGALGSAADLPADVQEVAGHLAVAAKGERSFSVERRLDLTDDATRAAVLPVVEHMASARRFALAPGTTAALRERLRSATVEARVHAIDEDRSHGGGVSGALAGLKVGGAAEHRRTRSHLVAAQSRGLDGQWLPRADCV